MTSLWFVTPAWQRFDLTAVCLEQRRRVIETLSESGIEAHCVVIADDANVDTARALGFDVLERDNAALGRRFNDGMEYAGRNGAEWIVPIGSDSWIDPGYFLGLHASFVRTSRRYCAVTADRLAELVVQDGKGAGPYVFSRGVLEPSGFRPADDRRPRHIDSSTVRGIQRTIGGPVPWTRSFEMHPYQYVGFRGSPTITPYERLVAAWGVGEREDPWSILARYYPVDLVERARAALSGQVVAA